MLHQIHFFLKILSAEDLSPANDVLFTFLQRLAAHDANEALYVEHVLLSAHDHLLGQQPVAATGALDPEQSMGQELIIAITGGKCNRLAGRMALLRKHFAKEYSLQLL